MPNARRYGQAFAAVGLLLLAAYLAGFMHSGERPTPISEALMVGDTFRYLGTNGPFGVQSLVVSVEAPTKVRSSSGEWKDVTSIRFHRTSEDYSTDMVAFVDQEATVVATGRPCLSIPGGKCQDIHEVSWLAEGSASPFLLTANVGEIVWSSDNDLHLPLFEVAKQESVVFSKTPNGHGCILLQPNRDLAMTVATAPYELSLRGTFEFCSGIPAPTKVAFRDMSYQLESYDRGYLPARMRLMESPPSSAVPDNGALLSESVLPPRGPNPAGFLDVHEAFEAANRLDSEFARYIQTHRDSRLLDSRGVQPASRTGPAGLGTETYSERFVRVGAGDGSAHSVTIRKVVATDVLGRTSTSYDVLDSGRAEKPFPGPRGKIESHLPITDGLTLSKQLVSQEFVHVEVNASSSLNYRPLEDRYHYRYYFRGSDIGGGFSLLYIAAFDSLERKPVYIMAPKRDIARFVEDSDFFQRSR